MHTFESYSKDECLDFVATTKPDVWTLMPKQEPKSLRKIYVVNYEIQNEDKFKIYSPDSIEWKRLEKCAKTMTQTDRKMHKYIVMEADVRHCGVYTTIADETAGYWNVIPNGTVYYNIVSGALDAITTAMQILGEDYVPLVEDAQQYVAVCFYGNNEQRIDGSLAQVSNWADNIIRACADDSITIHVNKKGGNYGK